MVARTETAKQDNWSKLPGRALTFALVIDAIFMAAYVITQHLPITPTTKSLIFLFDLNAEGNPAAWWQGNQLLLIALTFFALGLWFFQGDDRIAPLRRLFIVCGATFTYLSMDEIGQVHEYTSRMLQSWHWLNQLETHIFAAFGKRVHRFHGGSLWIPLFAVIGIALITWLWPQFRLAWRLWRREILLLAVGFAVLTFAATVLESLGDLIPKDAYTLRVIEVGVEETLESVGSTIVLYSVVRVLAAAGAALLPGVRAGNAGATPGVVPLAERGQALDSDASRVDASAKTAESGE
jgi:hypothetical protein